MPGLKDAAQKWLDTMEDGAANGDATKRICRRPCRRASATVDELAGKVPQVGDHAWQS